MAGQVEVTKLYNTFVKGLITEASPLTYPEDASVDEDNCLIYQKGNRTRRLGIDLEDGYSLSSFSQNANTFDNIAISEFAWTGAGNSNNFLAIQWGSTVYFYDIDSTPPISGNIKSYSIDLTTYTAPAYSDSNTAKRKVQFSSGQGLLFIVGPTIEPIVVSYDPDTNTFTDNRIYIQIRDFDGVDDNIALDEEPNTLSDNHRYNLKNQGWNTPNPTTTTFFDISCPTISDVYYFNFNGRPSTYTAPGDAPIIKYQSEVGAYPPNNKQWWVGVNSTSDFGAKILQTYSAGNTQAPKGHYILNAFNKDRSAFCDSSLSISPEVNDNRPTSVSFFAGRTWYGCNNQIYFSQVVENKRQVGMCYQVADPTDQNINQLVANDGGVVQIPEMQGVNRLFTTGSGILAFAANGVWFIAGTSGGFSADDYSVSKISPIGTSSPNSVVAVDGEIFWWSDIGIQGMSQKTGIFGPIQNNFDKLNISDTTIRTFYFSEIPASSKQYVKGDYDPATNTIVWLFSTANVTDRFRYDRVLNFDLTLKAFYPWTISNGDNTPWVIGVFKTPTLFELPNQIAQRRNTYLCYTTARKVGSQYYLSFSRIKDEGFVDWASFDPKTYSSYVETGYELLKDAIREKQAPWLMVYFRRTETEFVPVGSDYTVDKPSSCLLTAKWNWSSSSVSNKQYGPWELYRLSPLPSPDEEDLTLDTGFPIVYRRYKVRGRGRALEFRFESNGNSDFDLLGWSVEYAANARP